MDIHATKSIKEQTKMMLGTSLFGIGRVLVGFPIEHPIDAIKTQWQAQTHFKNEYHVCKHIYREKGIFRGFYAGSIPNLTRLICRNIYKYPLLMGLPELYKKQLPSLKDNDKVIKLLTGLSIAVIETTVNCPIERTKTFVMTKSYKGHSSLNGKNIQTNTYGEFWNHIKQNKSTELFRGYGPLFVKNCIYWSIFLQSDYFIKKQIRKYYQIADNESISNSLLFKASAFVALINTAIVMPFDCIKTHLEKVSPSNTYKQAVQQIYQQSGNSYLGFFTGVRLRFLMYFINSLFVVNILERFETLKRQSE